MTGNHSGAPGDVQLNPNTCSAYLQKEGGKKNPMKDGTQKRSIYLKKKKK